MAQCESVAMVETAVAFGNLGSLLFDAVAAVHGDKHKFPLILAKYFVRF